MIGTLRQRINGPCIAYIQGMITEGELQSDINDIRTEHGFPALTEEQWAAYLDNIKTRMDNIGD